ncbi:hypothetical protein BV898_01920 [Hypsibius exemplaris]|uniref:Uncharacterized protein n=1 Tax=Hypsibius exemplaris TaxID=2072580 RepID=A0A1W0XA26_HYPEX|nr:hypothetical protein BV898_01920 [Hypsibius exemplaris]
MQMEPICHSRIGTISHAQVFDLLTLGKLHEAAELPWTRNATDLGELITSIANPPVSPEMDAQSYTRFLLANLNTGTDIVTKILLLWTGMICDRFISACDGLDWLSCLGLYAVFAVNSDSDPSTPSRLSLTFTKTPKLPIPAGSDPPPSNSRQVPLSRPPVLLYDIRHLFLGRIDLEPLLQKPRSYSCGGGFRCAEVVSSTRNGYWKEGCSRTRALRLLGSAKLLIELKQFHKAGKLVLEKLLPRH